MRLVACSLVLVACQSGVDPDEYPVEPGGGGGGTFGNMTGTLPDAMSGGDGGATLTARVCGISNILALDECDAAGLAGLDVMIGASQATTMDTGVFEIATPSGSDLVWRVSGNAQLASLREYDPSDLTIPSISVILYEQIVADANLVIGNNVGAIIVNVTYQDAPVVGATATLAGLQDSVRYDDANAAGDFNIDATHAAGIIWFPNVTPGANVTFSITPPSTVGEPLDTTVPVAANTVTFATVEFPPPPP